MRVETLWLHYNLPIDSFLRNGMISKSRLLGVCNVSALNGIFTQHARRRLLSSVRLATRHGNRRRCVEAPQAFQLQSLSSTSHEDESGVPADTHEAFLSDESGVGDIDYESFNDDIAWEDASSKNYSKRDSRKIERIFLDSRDPLEERVNKFVNRKIGELHPLDIHLSAISLIREGGKRRSFEGMKFAQDIMDRILEEKRFVNQKNEENPLKPAFPYTIVISEKHFEVLMYGWANLCRQVSLAPERMREVLDLMIQEAEYDETIRKKQTEAGTAVEANPSAIRGMKHSDVNPAQMFANVSCQPTVGIYNTLLQGLGQASYRSMAAAGEAEDLLRSMERIARKRGWHTKPNMKSFMSVIQAFGRTRHKTAGERAESVLRRMIEYHERQLQEYEEETGLVYNLEDPSSNQRQIVTPDAIAFTGVIQAHGESGTEESTVRALGLLHEVVRENNGTLVPDAYLFSATINCFAKVASNLKDPAKRLEMAQGAEEILWFMVETMEMDKKDSDATENSYIVPFNACLNVWAQSDTTKSATQAEELLQKILDPGVKDKTGLEPNCISFNTCMRAWARASRHDLGAPQRAEDLLHMMEQLDFADADATSYATVMNAYARSNLPDKVQECRRILEAMLTNSKVTPSAAAFTVVLNAAVHSNEASNGTETSRETIDADAFGTGTETDLDMQEDAYGIALRTYDEIANDMYDLRISTDHLLFATMLDVVARYTDVESIERRQRLERVFDDACAAGEVSSLVVQALAKASPSNEHLTSTLQVESYPFASVNSLPRQWVQNVEPKFRKLRVPDRTKKPRKKRTNRGRNFNSRPS